MPKFFRLAAVASVTLLCASCAETAAMLDATATQMCRNNPTQECYDSGRI